ncbi:MAG TPA: hypothetical protein VIB48_05295 [Acidimicrobiia bacterium]
MGTTRGMGANEGTLSLLPEPPSRTRRVARHPDLAAQLTVRALRLALSEGGGPLRHVTALERLARGDRAALLRALQRVDGEDEGVDARARTLLTKTLERLDAAAFDERRPA